MTTFTTIDQHLLAHVTGGAQAGAQPQQKKPQQQATASAQPQSGGTGGLFEILNQLVTAWPALGNILGGIRDLWAQFGNMGQQGAATQTASAAPQGGGDDGGA